MALDLPFAPRLPPLFYQADYLRDHGHDESWGLIWDPGTGKTKGLIDNVALLVMEDLIDGCLVLAPNGVHRNWQTDELPKHWPLPTHGSPVPEYDAWLWDTDRSEGKRYQEDFKRWLSYIRSPTNPAGPIGFLLMSYDGLMTDRGKQASWDFIRKRRVMLIGDESQRFKTPAAKRQIRVFAISAYPAYKRIASGTPMDKPFDIYPQMRFLDEDFWKKTMGIGGFAAFRTHLGNWHKRKTRRAGKLVVYEVQDEDEPYRNLAELEAVLSAHTTRITEEQAELGLPPRLYKRVYHDLSTAQQQAYDEIKEECLTQLASGEIVTAEHVLTMRLRLMQVGCGFVTPYTGAAEVPFAENPRAEAYADLLTEIGGGEPTLTWCQFVQDARCTAEVSRSLGRVPVIYDAADPVHTLDLWKAGDAHDLIANLGSGLTEGQTLVRTAHVPYFSNTSRLITRQQSEKRAHRIGQLRSPTYYDFLARGTNDEAELERVRKKAHWAGAALGDDPALAAAWLRATLLGETPTEVGPAPSKARDSVVHNPGPEEYEAWLAS